MEEVQPVLIPGRQTLPLCRAPPASHPDTQGDADANGFKMGL